MPTDYAVEENEKETWGVESRWKIFMKNQKIAIYWQI
jgi:hypothetical protein